MKQQTAVEWFQSQIINIVNGNCELSEIEIFEKAKSMEKEQIEKAMDDGYNFATSEAIKEIQKNYEK